MTMPDERTRAVIWAHAFLARLASPCQSKRIPKAVREEARSILRHYPWPMDLCRGEQFDKEVVEQYYRDKERA